MRNQLKKFRVKAFLTQAKVAKLVGVTQPNYHRWESGNTPIPDDKLRKLAKLFEVSTETLLGKHPAVNAALYDDRAPEEHQYYGEVSIHFCGPGSALVLSISEKAHSDLYRDIQGDSKYVVVRSLSNQLVAIRRKAISDLYFSSEAYDDYGPEHENYDHIHEFLLPNSRDWEIIESLSMGDLEVREFDEAHVERIEKLITPTTDEEFKELVEKGHIEASEVEQAKIHEAENQEKIFEMASGVTYQLSSGKKRRVGYVEDSALYEGLWELFDWQGDFDSDIIRLPSEGYHRTIFINPESIDYLSVPFHKWDAARIEADEELIESSEEPLENPHSRRRKRSKKDNADGA